MTFHGQFNFDEFLYERYFKDYPKGTFLECGAIDGREISTCLFFEETLGWTGYNIEPVPAAYNLLIDNRPKAVNFNLALSNRHGVSKFTQAVHPQYGQLFGNGSLCHTQEHLAEIRAADCELETIYVRTTTFAWLMKHKPALDLMVLDVEGAELDVIAGMKGRGALPKIFAVEVNHVGLNAVTSMLKPLGYTFDAQHHDNAVFKL